MSEQSDDTQPGGPGLYLERQDADEGFLNELDPPLQTLVLALRNGEKLDSDIVSARGGKQYVDVIAKLRNPLQPVPGFEPGRSIGDIVTGAVAIGDIARVRRDQNVVSLKAAAALHPLLRSSVLEVRCDAEDLRAAFPGLPQQLDGSGAVVGIVDVGCDFNHMNFRRADKTTRLLYLWDQRRSTSGTPPAGFGYGREFDRTAIDAALRTDEPYVTLGYTPEPGAHGTHVMDIAAGSGGETKVPGIAPGADLIFVQLAADDAADDESLGNSRHLLEAVAYIFEKAQGRPAVVNLSLGTHGGPHDGSTLVEQGFERLLDQPGRAIVAAAGNSRNFPGHTHGTVERGQPKTLSWEIHAHDQTANELEVWYDASTPLLVGLVAPDGTELGPIGPGETVVIRKPNVKSGAGRIIHRREDPNNRANQIDILLQPELPSGIWKVVLSNPAGQPVAYHAWIERDGNGPSGFVLDEATLTHTLSSICCSARTITVGSYNGSDSRRTIAESSSEGPTRDGRAKPEVSAPGENIVAANAQSDFLSLSGTSMAAPHVSGLVALLFQAAGRALSADEVRQALQTSARQDPPAAGGDLRFGQGRINGVAALRAVTSAAKASEKRLVAPSERPLTLPQVRPERANGTYSLSDFLTRLQAGSVDIRLTVVEPAADA